MMRANPAMAGRVGTGRGGSTGRGYAQRRTFREESNLIKRVSKVEVHISKDFADGEAKMNVPAKYYMTEDMDDLMQDELRQYCERSNSNAGFLPCVKQLANVATLPGIVKWSIGLPDMHAGYGFAIGNVAAFDMENPLSVVSPGGVGFDINCGVRLIRTNLFEDDIIKRNVKEPLAQALYDHIPVGVGSQGIVPTGNSILTDVMELGMDWSVREGYAWAEDKEHCEEYGRMLTADPSKVSTRARKRGMPQLGTLGAGNHYGEIQIVDEIFDRHAAKRMGIEETGQVVVMIHCGSRGFGHQVATDALVEMESACKRDNIILNDKQLACARIHSKEGKDYFAAMSCAANYAFANRASMTFLARQAFSKVFEMTPDDLDMHVIYDVSHNVAKIEEHMVDGKLMSLLLHRKGSTRAFPPFHPLIPVDYQGIGQPVLVGGSMGTNSYVLTGTEKAMELSFGSTCHGAGREQSRNLSRNSISHEKILQDLADKGIAVRMASPKLVMEEAPESYKDVRKVVEACEMAGLSNRAFKMRPIAVIKG